MEEKGGGKGKGPWNWNENRKGTKREMGNEKGERRERWRGIE